MSKRDPRAFSLAASLLLFAAAVGVGVSASSQGGFRPDAQAAPEGRAGFSQASIDQGRQHFAKMCARCHGEDAEGDGPEHTKFIPRPANLTLVRLTRPMFASIIRHGIPGTAMPPHPAAPPDVVDALYAFIISRPIDTTLEWARPWRASPETLAAGTAGGLYATMCEGCHGPTGEGDGYWARNNNHVWPKPANFKARNSELGRLYYVISNGLEGTMMAPQAPKLSDAARWALAEYVYALFDSDSEATIDHGLVERYTNPLSLSDQSAIETGKETYDLYCAYCHGVAGKGSFLAPTLVDRDWLFGGGTDNALFVVLKNGIPGKLMPAHAALDDRRLWSVVTYIRSRGGLQHPLPTEPAGHEHEQHKEPER